MQISFKVEGKKPKILVLVPFVHYSIETSPYIPYEAMLCFIFVHEIKCLLYKSGAKSSSSMRLYHLIGGFFSLFKSRSHRPSLMRYQKLFHSACIWLNWRYITSNLNTMNKFCTHKIITYCIQTTLSMCARVCVWVSEWVSVFISGILSSFLQIWIAFFWMYRIFSHHINYDTSHKSKWLNSIM